jgi:ribosomal protein L35AE/L33A
MDVRKNKIAQTVAQFSTEDLNAAYKDIVTFRETGVCPEGKLREIELAVRNVMEQISEVFQHTEDYVLMEMARRLYNATNSDDYASLRAGAPICYLDSDSGEVERGIVHGVYFEKGKITTVSIDFEDDFDEFDGKALGHSLFLSEEAAMAFWQQGNCTKTP